MECWAHAAARRRRSPDTESADSSIADSSSSSIASCASSDFYSIPRDCEPSMSDIFDGVDDMLRRPLPKDRKLHVCVVGAGIAGLRCADILKRHGIKVTILEGRDRVGGRVHQNHILGHIADVGPNWIHGVKNNPILELANETGTAHVSPPEDVAPEVYEETGQKMASREAADSVGTVWEIILEANEFSKKHGSSIPPSLSLVDFFKTKLEERQLDEATCERVHQIAKVWGDIIGEPIECQSLKFFWLEECVDEENLFLAGTYKAILDLVASAALQDTELCLKTVVRELQSPKNGAHSDHITVTSSENVSRQFDEVVITAPLGWLKRNLRAFDPSLPARMVKSINNISYGRLEKVYITFPKAFWMDPHRDPNVSQTFQMQFLSPSYATETNPSKWSIEVVNLASLPSDLAHPTLLFYINGPCAAHVTSLQHDPRGSNSQPAIDARLLTFFRPYYSLLSNYKEDSTECKPLAVMATDWIHDDLAGNGSYTNFQTSPDDLKEPIELDKDIVALRHGCPERRLWFAGEHTAPFVALGTVTGAYWSGEAVARRVGQVYGLSLDGEGDIPAA